MAQGVTWSLESYFPEFDGDDYRNHVLELESALGGLGEMAGGLGPLAPDNLVSWEEVFLLNERVMTLFSHLASYLSCLTAADVAHEGYKAEEARLSRLGAAYAKALAPVKGALRNVDDAVFDTLAQRPALASAQYYLGRMRDDARWTMAPEMEVLAADLSVDGLSAWGRLYDELSGRLEFDLEQPDGSVERVPMAQKRALMEDPDPQVRVRALAGSNRAWESVDYVAATCLNSIAGTRLTLYRYRGIEHFLDRALFDAAIERSTLDAMWMAVEKARPVAWEYLRQKARILGKTRLGFQDLSCPLPMGDVQRISWEEGRDRVLEAFAKGYPALGDFARTMLNERRVESEKRPGKRPGAFCTTSLQSRESRVFMTFGGGIGDVQTLAHELGHAFHGYTLGKERPMASRYPMTLAETASIYAERIFQDAVLDDASVPNSAKLAVLTARLNDATTFLCDIHMRFLFETAFYEERAKGEVPLSRIKELMLDAQRSCYGDTLAEGEMDPMFWASKLHFYITGVSFYNFPYTFGYLFSLGLSGLRRRQGSGFGEQYEALLRLTGSGTVETVARQGMGIDLTSKDFWEDALAGLAEDVARFERLIGEENA